MLFVQWDADFGQLVNMDHHLNVSRIMLIVSRAREAKNVKEAIYIKPEMAYLNQT